MCLANRINGNAATIRGSVVLIGRHCLRPLLSPIPLEDSNPSIKLIKLAFHPCTLGGELVGLSSIGFGIRAKT